MEKTLLIHLSPVIITAISFCVTGIGMVGYLYYSDFVVQDAEVDGNIATKFAPQKDVTVYEVTNKDISPNVMILPSQVSIIDDYNDKKNSILSLDDLFRALWIPLLIIGSYLLIHSEKGIISKVEV
ncbi:MAG TPA: hypothetical protein VLA53_03465 [Nitrosopumilaceae archaeon]|nr:hypothetical protein [Nitrosopumilaceae archaeon]